MAQDVITKISPSSGAEIIEIGATEVCDVLNMNGEVWVASNQDLFADGVSKALLSINSAGTQSAAQLFPVAGPCWIHVKPFGVISYRIRPNSSTSSSTPANAVVIPTDATGSVQIILESSTDLITWTQANPGTYGASTAKRFFRIRAVNQ